MTPAQVKELNNALLVDSAPDESILPSDLLFNLNAITDLSADRPTFAEQSAALAAIPAGPAGAQGVQGPAGPAGATGPVGPAGLEWQGAWAAATTYAADDAVGYGGASYFCILGITGNVSNADPASDTTHWALLAAQGATGATGATGAQGPQGPQGPAGTSAAPVYKEYVALFTTGTTPTMAVLANTFANVQFSVGSTGTYSLSSVGYEFTENKTAILIGNPLQSNVSLRAEWVAADIIEINQFVSGSLNSGGFSTDVTVMIRVYP